MINCYWRSPQPSSHGNAWLKTNIFEICRSQWQPHPERLMELHQRWFSLPLTLVVYCGGSLFNTVQEVMGCFAMTVSMDVTNSIVSWCRPLLDIHQHLHQVPLVLEGCVDPAMTWLGGDDNTFIINDGTSLIIYCSCLHNLKSVQSKRTDSWRTTTAVKQKTLRALRVDIFLR